MIRIGIKGQILQGDSEGYYVLFQDDMRNTGGYLILTAEDLEFKKGFDGWVENYEALQAYVDESNWKIKWLE